MACLEICQNVIAVDGPDGVGKSTFCLILKEEIDKITETALIRVTAFDESEKAIQIGEMFARISPLIQPNSLLHNRFFLLATRCNYRDTVLRLVKEGKTVILDSSELRSLAFIDYQGAHEAYADTVSWFLQGKLTYNLVPEERIILFASPEDILFNLEHRNKQDYGDPKDLTSVRHMIECYQKAIVLSHSLHVNGLQQIKNIMNPFSKNAVDQLRGIAKRITGGRI